MASTNKTTNYDLSQYVGSDKPTYLSDYNGDMFKIDAQMKVNADNVATAISTANTATTTATNAMTTATTATTTAETASTTANNAHTTANNAMTKATAVETELDSATTFSSVTLTPSDTTNFTGSITLLKYGRVVILDISNFQIVNLSANAWVDVVTIPSGYTPVNGAEVRGSGLCDLLGIDAVITGHNTLTLTARSNAINNKGLYMNMAWITD